MARRVAVRQMMKPCAEWRQDAQIGSSHNDGEQDDVADGQRSKHKWVAGRMIGRNSQQNIEESGLLFRSFARGQTFWADSLKKCQAMAMTR